jgi:hypothetical protein
MASNINDTNINEQYPVAGRDNDSQGFRDNFNVIKSNFTAAKAEIEDLQDNTAKLNEDNNFLGNEISNAVLLQTPYKTNSPATIANNSFIDYSISSVQSYSVSNDITFTLTGFNDVEGYAWLRVLLLNNGTNKTITFDSVGTIRRDPNWPTEDNSVPVNSDVGYTVIDFFTVDSGTNIYAEYKGQFTAAS